MNLSDQEAGVSYLAGSTQNTLGKQRECEIKPKTGKGGIFSLFCMKAEDASRGYNLGFLVGTMASSPHQIIQRQHHWSQVRTGHCWSNYEEFAYSILTVWGQCHLIIAKGDMPGHCILSALHSPSEDAIQNSEISKRAFSQILPASWTLVYWAHSSGPQCLLI